MWLPRWLTLKIHFVLDYCVPPILRDSKWFMYLPFRLLFGSHYRLFSELKGRAMTMSPEDFRDYYREIDPHLVQRPTDLSEGCIREIRRHLTGRKILEVGCGKGYLARILSQDGDVTACDLQIASGVRGSIPQVRFVEANAESLPFDDGTFDVVISCHMLEHVQDFRKTCEELRRVCRGRLIVVVPRQKPYRWTFDPHIHFFPYRESLLIAMGPGRRNKCWEVSGELFYIEEVVPQAERTEEVRPDVTARPSLPAHRPAPAPSPEPQPFYAMALLALGAFRWGRS